MVEVEERKFLHSDLVWSACQPVSQLHKHRELLHSLDVAHQQAQGGVHGQPNVVPCFECDGLS